MRLLNLLRKDYFEAKKGMLIYALTVFLILFVQYFITAFLSRLAPVVPAEGATGYSVFFINLLFIGGFVITSISFTDDMYGKTTQHNWLMLPATPLEKLISRILTTGIIYPLVLVIFMTVVSAFIEALTLLFFQSPFGMFNPITSLTWKLVLHYFITQSIFLLGSSYFKKISLLKTVLAISVLGLVLSILAMLFARIAFAPYFQGFYQPNEVWSQYSFNFDPTTVTIAGIRIFEILGKTIYWFVLAPFFWVFTYFRIREVQAKDAV